MASLDIDLAPFATSPTSPNAGTLTLPRLATDTDATERQINAQVEATLSDIASLLGSNRYYRRESQHGNALVPRASLPFTPDADVAARTFALANGFVVNDGYSGTSSAPPQTRSVSFQEDGVVTQGGGGISADQARALCLQLEQARDLVRRLDSERRFYRQRALRQQKELDHASEEKLAMSVRASEGHRMSLDTEGLLSQARAHVRQQEAALDQQAEELLALRRFIRSLPPVYAQAYDLQVEEGSQAAAPLADALHLVPDRRFEEAFRDKMDVIGFKRRCSRARAACEETSARYEGLCMTCEDADAGGVSAQIAAVSGRRATSGERESADSTSPALVAAPTSFAMPTAAALLQQRRRSSVLDFPVSVPFSPATPQDAEIKSLILRSAYAEPLMEARDGLLRLSTRLKLAEENGLQSLYGILGDVVRRLPPTDRAMPQKAFEKQMDTVQRAQRELLFQLVAFVNSATVNITTAEKRLAQRTSGAANSGYGYAARKSCHDVACMATDTSMEDYRLHQMETQVRQKELRLLEERGESEKKVLALSSELQQQQGQTLAILESLGELERSVAASTRLALRHQRAGNDVVERVTKDPFGTAIGASALRTQDLADTRLAAKVADSVDVTVGCLRQLTSLTVPVTPTKTSDGDTDGAAPAASAGDHKLKGKKKLSLPSRRSSGGFGLPNRVPSRSRSQKRKPSQDTVGSRGSVQDIASASSLPDYTQPRRHTLPAVPTAASSGRSAGARSTGRSSIGVPTPPPTSLAAKADGQAPRRPSVNTSLVLDPNTVAAAAAQTDSVTPNTHGALTPLSVNASRRSSTAAAPDVAHTARRKTACEAVEAGQSPVVSAPSATKTTDTHVDGDGPRTRSVTREPDAANARSREAALATVAIVNIELFRNHESPHRD